MRAKELLSENYQHNLEMDLSNLLASAKALGLTSIKTKSLIDELSQMGYSVTPNNIVVLTSSNPYVVSATPDEIGLTAGEMDDGQGVDAQDNEAKVADLASKASSL